MMSLTDDWASECVLNNCGGKSPTVQWTVRKKLHAENWAEKELKEGEKNEEKGSKTNQIGKATVTTVKHQSKSSALKDGDHLAEQHQEEAF